MRAASYASKTRGLVTMLRESVYQVKSELESARRAEPITREFIERMGRDEATIAERLGRPVRGLDVLDVGTGALASQALYFALRRSRVTSIDLDITVTGHDPRDYVKLAQANGPRRAIKTFARELIGWGRAFRREMTRQMDAEGAAPPTLLQMDAARMSFPDASFDVVYSYDVFEHIADLEGAASEVARVLRPGGVAMIVLLPYTSEGGPHDYRAVSGHRGDLPYWAHLRPEHHAKVRPGAYVNGKGAREAQAVFQAAMPGARFSMPQEREDSALAGALRALRAAGELGEHTDEELLAIRLQVLWKKPAPGGDP